MQKTKTKREWCVIPLTESMTQIGIVYAIVLRFDVKQIKSVPFFPEHLERARFCDAVAHLEVILIISWVQMSRVTLAVIVSNPFISLNWTEYFYISWSLFYVHWFPRTMMMMQRTIVKSYITNVNWCCAMPELKVLWSEILTSITIANTHSANARERLTSFALTISQ